MYNESFLQVEAYFCCGCSVCTYLVTLTVIFNLFSFHIIVVSPIVLQTLHGDEDFNESSDISIGANN